jgi:hypothetical protein
MSDHKPAAADHTSPQARAQLRKAALEYHEFPTPGKVAIQATKQLVNQHDLSLAYSPGVAAPCEEIVKDPNNAFKYTSRGNLVAVIPNGTAVLGLGATVHTSKRKIAADDFFQGMFTTALEQGEILTAIEFPIPAKAGYAKMKNPASRYVMAGAFIVKTKAGAVRVAINGAAPCVFRQAEMEKALDATWSADAVAGVKQAADGLNSDIHGSAEYRAHLVTVMAKRAVATAG